MKTQSHNIELTREEIITKLTEQAVLEVPDRGLVEGEYHTFVGADLSFEDEQGNSIHVHKVNIRIITSVKPSDE